jgi:hypothetical protein
MLFGSDVYWNWLRSAICDLSKRAPAPPYIGFDLYCGDTLGKPKGSLNKLTERRWLRANRANNFTFFYV